MQTPPPGMTGAQRENMEQDNTGNAVADGPTALSDIFARPEPVATQADQAGQAEPQAAPQAEPETGETVGQPRDEAGKFAPKAAPPAAEKSAEEGRISALKAEREKRQGLERELAELRARYAAQPAQQAPVQQAPQPPAPPPVPLTDMLFQDPDGFVRTQRQELEQSLLQTRIAMSEAMARQQYPDYADAEAALDRYAKSSPTAQAEVARMLNAHPAPALIAYQAGKHLLAQQEWQPLQREHATPEAWRQAERERIRAEVLAEQAQQSPTNPAPRLPASLAGARASQGRNASVYAGPQPLSAILGQRR